MGRNNISHFRGSPPKRVKSHRLLNCRNYLILHGIFFKIVCILLGLVGAQ